MQPKLPTYPIVSALRTQFNWIQYRSLIQVKDPVKLELGKIK